MSNDGTATPGPEGPEPSPWPAPGTGDERPAAPAPSGYEADAAAGPAPSGYEAPTASWPSAPGTPPAGDPAAEQPGSGPAGGYGAPASGAPGYGAPGYGQPGSPQAGYPQPGGEQPPAAPQPGYGPAGQPGYGGYPQPTGPAQPAGGFPAGPGASGYPPPPGAGYPQAPYGGQYPAPQARGTDGVSIAALVTGVLMMGVVPIVLGILGLNRTKKNGTQGRGLAIAGIVLGALEILGAIAIAIIVLVAVRSYDARMDDLRTDCAAGDMAACDDLYDESNFGTDEEDFGWTCGGRTQGGGGCTDIGAFTYGDDEDLDALWDACDGGDMAACDELYFSSGSGTDYQQFGDTCGGQTAGGDLCDTGTGGAGGTVDGAQSYGDDPDLDALWDACEAGDAGACDDLYWSAPSGSEYEDFGGTCGNRSDSYAICEDLMATS